MIAWFGFWLSRDCWRNAHMTVHAALPHQNPYSVQFIIIQICELHNASYGLQLQGLCRIYALIDILGIPHHLVVRPPAISRGMLIFWGCASMALGRGVRMRL